MCTNPKIARTQTQNKPTQKNNIEIKKNTDWLVKKVNFIQKAKLKKKKRDIKITYILDNVYRQYVY